LVSIFLWAYPLVHWIRKKRVIVPKEENEG